MPWARPRISLASMTLLVATAASALGLVAAVAHLDLPDEEESRLGMVVLGSMLAAAVVGAGVVVAWRLGQGFERATAQVGLACLADIGLIRLLEWGGGTVLFLLPLGVILAVLLPAAALDLFRPRVAPARPPSGLLIAAEVVACTFLVMVLGLFGTIPLGGLIGVAIELLWILGRH